MQETAWGQQGTVPLGAPGKKTTFLGAHERPLLIDLETDLFSLSHRDKQRPMWKSFVRSGSAGLLVVGMVSLAGANKPANPCVLLGAMTPPARCTLEGLSWTDGIVPFGF